jgi:hypothetical protein
VDCTGSTSCKLECGEAAACHFQCNGKRTADCGAGMTCNGSCEGVPTMPTIDAGRRTPDMPPGVDGGPKPK